MHGENKQETNQLQTSISEEMIANHWHFQKRQRGNLSGERIQLFLLIHTSKCNNCNNYVQKLDGHTGEKYLR